MRNIFQPIFFSLKFLLQKCNYYACYTICLIFLNNMVCCYLLEGVVVVCLFKKNLVVVLTLPIIEDEVLLSYNTTLRPRSGVLALALHLNGPHVLECLPQNCLNDFPLPRTQPEPAVPSRWGILSQNQVSSESGLSFSSSGSMLTYICVWDQSNARKVQESMSVRLS